MRTILRLAAVVAFAAALVVPVQAAVDATFVLRSGERISGSLVDFSARGVTARVGGDTRTISAGDLAVIDFTNAGSFPATETSRVGGGVNALVLRDGSVILGRLSDVGGTNPLRISFVADGTTRNFNSNEVARIHFARANDTRDSGGGGNLQPGTGQIRVPATSDWVSTGRFVRQGQRVTLRSSGQVRLNSDGSNIANPAGSVKGSYTPGAPLPNALMGALIGRIGNSAPFGIGDQSSFTAPASGMLFLRVNDDNLSDNAGEFAVDLIGR